MLTLSIASQSHPGRSAMLLAVCAGLALTLGACASRKPDITTALAPNEAARHAGINALKDAAARQLSMPDQRAISLAGAGVALKSSGGPAERRDIELITVLAQFEAPSVDASPRQPSQPEQAQGEDSVESVKLYISGKSKLIAGQFPAALADLEAAAKLSPRSADILGELAQAQAASGKRSAAVATYRRAVALGLKDGRVAAFLGRETLRSRQFDAAAKELSRAVQLSREQNLVLTACVAGADLADALYNLGYERAAQEMLIESLKALPPAESVQPRPEEAELYRRRGELWQRAGDIAAMAGRMPEAVAAYEAAASMPGADVRELAERQVFVLAGQGRSAQAALDLLSQIGEQDSKTVQSRIDALSRLARNSGIANEILAGVTHAACVRQMIKSPTVRQNLMFSVAGANGSGAERKSLSLFMLAVPECSRAAAGYFAAFGRDVLERAAAVAEVCAARPDQAMAIARSLYLYGDGTSEALNWFITERSRPGAWILGTCLEAICGRRGDKSALGDAPSGVPRDTAVAVTLLAAAYAGDWEKAQSACSALTDSSSPELRAMCSAALQQFEHAVGVARRALHLSGMVRSTWLLELDRNKEAEELLEVVRSGDRFDERPYEALLGLYAPKAPLASEEKLGATAKALRDAIPDSKIALSVSAREAFSHGQWKAAAEACERMLDPHEENGAALALLITTCERTYATIPELTIKAEQLVNGRLVTRPDAPLLVMAKARLLRITGKAAEAETLLAEYTSRIDSGDARRLREMLLREQLGNVAKADELAKARLTSGHLTIDEALEYGTVLATRGDFAEATAALDRGLPTTIPLTKAQAGRLIAIVEQIKPLDFLSDPKLPAAQALALFDRMDGRGISLPRQLRLSRLVLLCAARGSDTQAILDAIDKEARLAPEEKERLPQQVVSLLLAKPSAKEALHLIGELANRTNPVSETFGRQWLLYTAIRGDIEDVKYLVEKVNSPGALLRLAAKEDATDVTFDGDEASQRAELAYVIGNFASSEAREDIAEGAYRLTIKTHPDHAWALNNLGYYLLERGDAMEEASKMITASYQQLSEQPSVIDSFAWLKYKRGQFEDLRMPDGNSSPGAVTLMEQVVRNQARPVSFEQLDHYGDALWRVGRKLEAKTQWEAAQRLVDSQLSLAAAARGQAGEASPPEKRLMGMGKAIAAKAIAAATGQVPAVAMTQEERSKAADHK